MSIIEKIKQLKKQKNLTNKELSTLCGIPLGTVNKILASDVSSIKTDTLKAFAKGLNVPLEQLFNTNMGVELNAFSDNLGYVRVSTMCPETIVGAVEHNTCEIINSLNVAEENGAKLVVFPELTITGYTCGDLFFQDVLLSKAVKSLIEIKNCSVNYNMLIIVGCPLKNNGRLYNTAVAIFNGEILAVIPKTFLPNYNEFSEKRYFYPAENFNSEITILDKTYPFGTKIILKNNLMPSFTVSAELCEDLFTTNSPSIRHSLNGANIIVNLSASDEIVGASEYRKNLIKSHSSKCVCGYVYSNAGMGESTSDLIYSGHSLICEKGKVLRESKPFSCEKLFADIDCSYIESERLKLFNYSYEKDNYLTVPFSLPIENKEITREYSKTPFIPSGKNQLDERIELILNIQAQALKRRITHINCKTVVVGVSGGLDSTLALLVCNRALKLAGRNPQDLIAVTMPCFGTTSRTKNNSILLANALNCTFREVNIAEAVKVHLKDIGHDETTFDVAYENAQARERTQVIMDIANMTNGIVIGTGDLSELALGWATYNGDHMSMYGVNGSIPKTLIRFIISHVAENSEKDLKEILLDILDTPVSPELIPAVNDKITQKTEDLVGPYLLHDFFLYYLIRMSFKPSKVYKIAVKTFSDKFDRQTIYKWLNTFINRFFNQQFKRSCLPDGVKVGTISFSPRGDWHMPSDCNKEVWLNDLKLAKDFE